MESKPLFAVLALRVLEGAGPPPPRRRRTARRRRVVVAGVLLAVASVLVAGVAVARAAWTPPFDLSAPAAGEVPRVAAGPGGAVVAWRGTVIRARRVEPGGALGPVLDLSATVGDHPDVAIDAQGVATVVWEEDAAVRARRISAAGAAGPVIDVSPAGEEARAPRVAVDPAGVATVVWHRPEGGFSYTIRARQLDAAGTLGAAVDLSDASASPVAYRVAADPRGGAYAVWARQGVIQGRQVGAALGPVDDHSGGDASWPALALDPAGAATVVWQLGNGTIQLRRRAPGGTLGTTHDVAADAFQPEVGVDAAGTAVVAWARFDGTTQRAELRRVDASGAVGATTDLWAGGSDEEPQIAVGPDGDATVAWLNFDDAGAPIMRARAVAADGTLGAPDDLSPPGEAELQDPVVAADAAGDVVAVWTRHAAPDNLIVGARLLAPAPPLAPPPPPAPAAPAPAVQACPPVAVERITARRSGRRRVVAKLTLTGTAEVDLRAASVVYRRAGKRRTASVGARMTGAGAERTLRLRLPRAARRGRVKALKLRVRARAACAPGAATTLRARARVRGAMPASAS